jgi:hypothetical protein
MSIPAGFPAGSCPDRASSLRRLLELAHVAAEQVVRVRRALAPATQFAAKGRNRRYAARPFTEGTKGVNLRTKWGAGVIALALVLAGVAAAATSVDVLTLYPAAGGQQTYAAWKAQEGQPDSSGSGNQALYLQNLTGALDTAAAAHVRGFEGTEVRFLVSIGYEYRKDSTCTKTDPRWTLFIRGKSGKRYLVTLGCAVTPVQPTGAPGWIGRIATQSFIRAQVLQQRGSDAYAGTIDGLAFVMDRSNGAVWADNIRIRSRFASKVWTFAGDNGNGTPPAAPSFSAEDRALLAEDLPAAALLDEAEVMASLSPEQQATIAEDADPS